MTSEAYKANLRLIDWSDFKPRERRARAAPARSSLPCPQIVRAFAEPVQSQADGKWYDNPRDLSNSHKASGNPQGIDYIEIGNERVKYEPPQFDEKERREDIRRSLHDVISGNVSPEVAAIE